MEIYELPFTKIIVLSDHIAEVIINEGIEINMDMVEQSHDFLLSHLHAPFSLLINNVNAYSYDFSAQGKLAALKEINAIAVVAYRRSTEIATEVLASQPRDVELNLKIFRNRDDALDWLLSEQQISSRLD